MNTLEQQLVALLFTAQEAQTRQQLCASLGCTEEQLAATLNTVTAYLVDSGLGITQTATGIQLTTSQTVANFLSTLQHGEDDTLSAAAAETLSLVAYKEPITRAEIDAIRGVDSSRIVRLLVVRGLIERHRTGSGYEYRVTTDFMRHLGITSVAELPDYETLSSTTEVERILSDSVH